MVGGPNVGSKATSWICVVVGLVMIGGCMRNASLPVATLVGWETIRAIAGYSVVVETVFAWPGLGLTAIQAIEREDLILLQAIVFSVAVLVVMINILMDIAYTLIDPRLRLA